MNLFSSPRFSVESVVKTGHTQELHVKTKYAAMRINKLIALKKMLLHQNQKNNLECLFNFV